MFRLLSNDTLKYSFPSGVKLPAMHDSMTRLYSVAAEKGTVGQSNLARKLGESPQTVKNWESRGLSKSGAMAAQEQFGCDANWLLGGPASRRPDALSTQAASLNQVLEAIAPERRLAAYQGALQLLIGHLTPAAPTPAPEEDARVATPSAAPPSQRVPHKT